MEALPPKETDRSVPTTGDRIRAIIEDYRPQIEKTIQQAHEFESPLTDEQITKKIIDEMAVEKYVDLTHDAFISEESGETIEPIVNAVINLYDRFVGSDFEALFDDLYYLETLEEHLAALQLENPATEIVDWADEIESYDFGSTFRYHIYRFFNEVMEDEDTDDIDQDIIFGTRQVMHTYATDLPGIKLVILHPTTQHGEDYRIARKETINGEEYDFPVYFGDLHSIQLHITPEAYRESLKD